MLFATTLLLVLVASAHTQEMSTQIIKLFELARHGARAPEPGNLDPTFSFFDTPQCCGQANWTRTWPMGLGGLTTVGASQHQANGRALRSRYSNTSALPQTYVAGGPVALLVAPNCARCQDSLLNQTIGLFGNDTNVPANILASDAFWWKQKSTCKPVALNVFDNVDSRRYTQFAADSQNLLLGACQNSTLNSTCANITASQGGLVQNFGIPYCGDTVFSSWYYESSNGTGLGNELPNWMSDDMMKACMDSINTGLYFAVYHNASQPSFKNNSLPLGAQLMIGNLLQTVSVFFSGNASYAQAPAPNNNYQFPTGINLNGSDATTFVLAVGHETEVAALLTALSAFGDYEFLQPPFASLVMLELHQDTLNTSGLYVRVLYRHQYYNQPQAKTDILPLSFCPNATVTNGYLCPLEQFVTTMKTMYISGPIAEEEVCAAYTRTGSTTATATATFTSLSSSARVLKPVVVLIVGLLLCI